MINMENSKHKLNGEVTAIQWTGENLEEIQKFHKSAYTMGDGGLYIHDDSGSCVFECAQYPAIGSYLILTGEDSMVCISEKLFKELKGDCD